jgi:ribosomal protein L11 methyltransferase
MDLRALDADAVEEIFLQSGAQSVTLTDAADNPVLEPAPGEAPLWVDTRITGLFPADADFEELENKLLHDLGIGKLPPHRIEKLEDRAWEREWLKDFQPMRFGDRLWICPGDMQTDQRDAVVVRLDPGLAFGTGTHPTTALCLEWLDALDNTGPTILDYGCGSGVLAIAALKLGAEKAVAMDIDPQALIATRLNAERNDVAGRVEVLGSDEAIEGRFDVVVANILAGPLVELVHSITSRLSKGGKLALSGVLSAQVLDIMHAYKPLIRFNEPVLREQDGQSWALLSGTRI